MARRRTLGVLAAAASAFLVLAGCSSGSTGSSVPFAGCDAVACVGVIDGAPYEIAMPANWNGTLLIYSHGYRPAFGGGAGRARKAEPVPGWSSGDRTVGNELLDQGFALAGSAYKTDGWAVSDGVTADEDLYAFFSSKVAKPKRVFVWGDSLGGLITQTVAEKHPEWVTAAAPLCGPLAGVIPNFDLALDISYAVKLLLDPQLQLVNFSSSSDAVSQLRQAAGKVAQAATGNATSKAKLGYIAGLVNGPTKTKAQDGSNQASTLAAYTEGIETALGFATVARYDIEQRYGGNISGNTGADYSTRLTDTEKSFVNSYSLGAVAKFDSVLAKGARVAANPAARARAMASGGDPKANIRVPTFTMHTAFDDLVEVQNESFFKARYDVSDHTATLVQAFTLPPSTYSPQPGAPYGAGHCNFTNYSRVGTIKVLNDWVNSGTVPSSDAINVDLGQPSGYDGAYVPPPWPAGPTSRR